MPAPTQSVSELHFIARPEEKLKLFFVRAEEGSNTAMASVGFKAVKLVEEGQDWEAWNKGGLYGVAELEIPADAIVGMFFLPHFAFFSILVPKDYNND